MGVQQFFCPVCHVQPNRTGAPFVSEWAVASHVAGCIRVGDKLHEAWAGRYAPEVDLSQSVPRVAEALLRFIRLAMESSPPQPPSGTQDPVAVLHQFERKLHRYIRQRLEEKLGVEDEAWWMSGVPLQIRQDCAGRREADPERGDPCQVTLPDRPQDDHGEELGAFRGRLRQTSFDFPKSSEEANSRVTVRHQRGPQSPFTSSACPGRR